MVRIAAGRFAHFLKKSTEHISRIKKSWLFRTKRLGAWMTVLPEKPVVAYLVKNYVIIIYLIFLWITENNPTAHNHGLRRRYGLVYLSYSIAPLAFGLTYASTSNESELRPQKMVKVTRYSNVICGTDVMCINLLYNYMESVKYVGVPSNIITGWYYSVVLMISYEFMIYFFILSWYSTCRFEENHENYLP
jgi:hypothetical protein